MARLLSGSTLRRGGSGEFLDLKGAMPQLPPTPTTSTGYTLVTNELLQTSYRSSLGNLEFNLGEVYSNLPDDTIRFTTTGTGTVIVTSSTFAQGTDTGALIVRGGIAIGKNIVTQEDISVNGLRIGTGDVYEGFIGKNNVVIQGPAEAPVNDYNEGQNSVVIGRGALEAGFETSNKNIAIGRYALYTGTYISKSIAIGDSALKEIGKYQTIPLRTITSASQTNPVVLTIPSHSLTTATKTTVYDVAGMEELNTNNTYYLKPLTSNTVALYWDIILTNPVNGTAYGTYTSGGILARWTENDKNVAIGTDAGTSLIDGEQNFLLGDSVGRNLTTGSYNIFIGHDIAYNVKTGSGNISIGGDNIQDGKDNQVNIGGVFYYDGTGTLHLSADTKMGLGIDEFGSTSSPSLTILGSAAIYGDLWVGGDLLADAATVSSSTSHITGGSTGSLVYQTATNATGFISIGAVGDVLYSDGTNPYWGPPAALSSTTATYAENILVNAVTPSTLYYLALSETIGDQSPMDGDTKLTYSTTASTLTVPMLVVSSTATSTSTTTGALTVAGGLGVRGSIYSKDGNPNHNYLLYTPVTSVSTTTPASPRLGDFWVNPNNGAFLQYIKDGTSTFWLQVGSI